MKKLILATMMLCASTAQAADWSPVFKGWVGDCLYFEHPVAKAVFKASSDEVPSPYHDFSSHITDTVLSREGELGDYSTVPMPYRQDLLPAGHLYRRYSYFPEYENKSNEPQGVYIPLKNAKFYNLPLHSIEFHDYTTGWYSALNFGKYSKAKEQQLQKIIKPLQKNSRWDSARIQKTKDNELILLCIAETSG